MNPNTSKPTEILLSKNFHQRKIIPKEQTKRNTYVQIQLGQLHLDLSVLFISL